MFKLTNSLADWPLAEENIVKYKLNVGNANSLRYDDMMFVMIGTAFCIQCYIVITFEIVYDILETKAKINA